jgi:2-polyprenyl-6-methoxyphenol hydroxylase-like FAD-dependent oxidoreductase
MTIINQSQRISRHDGQVLIVGAGPTGLVLACELLAHGVRTRVIDKGDGVVVQTRALGIHARTLEVFDMMGLAERFVSRGQVVRRFRMYADGKGPAPRRAPDEPHPRGLSLEPADAAQPEPRGRPAGRAGARPRHDRPRRRNQAL